MKTYRYKVSLPGGKQTYCSNGTELDMLLSELDQRGVDVKQLKVEIVPQDPCRIA